MVCISLFREQMGEQMGRPENQVSDAISAAARQLSYTLPASAIVTYTATGHRPACGA